MRIIAGVGDEHARDLSVLLSDEDMVAADPIARLLVEAYQPFSPPIERGIRLYCSKNPGSSYLFCFITTDASWFDLF
jgi:hypothetical protein